MEITHAIAADNPDSKAPSRIREMAGTWNVEQWMWSGPGTAPMALPPAVSHRHLIGDAFLEDVMTAAPGTQNPFTRIAYFDYNTMSRQYEYFSIDTRAPQMMNETSFEARSASDADGALTLYGSIFVAPQWGPASNVPFRYRIVVGTVKKDRQTVELFLTPLSKESAAEFLAFRYLYTRAPSSD